MLLQTPCWSQYSVHAGGSAGLQIDSSNLFRGKDRDVQCEILWFGQAKITDCFSLEEAALNEEFFPVKSLLRCVGDHQPKCESDT